MFVDVGANVGTYTIPLAERFARVYAIDPDPYNTGVLAMNCVLNGLRNVSILPLAAWSDDRQVGAHFVLPGSHPHVIVSDETDGAFMRCCGMMLDHLRDEPVGLLKVDVENCGARVLAGARALIERNRPFIQFEVHSDAEGVPLRQMMADLRYTLADRFSEREIWCPS